MTRDEREKRLAAALRDNLKRRKARARALTEQPERESDTQGDRDDQP